ncbi:MULTISPECIES: mannonate dehydratase [Halorussus]|uniref:mannonate dehydratase n=1 Tax=Halorussus TaxID=1070314 RepID=UPI00209FF467|nr:mannonate dehydratase [Halorussus vallis]USZ74580.1 mannonate dehydratase [Halorussus vallis]
MADTTVAEPAEGEAVEDRMRVGFRTREFSDARLRFIKQLGVNDVFLDHSAVEEEPDEFIDNTQAGRSDTLTLGGEYVPSVEELVQARTKIEDAGLSLTGVHSLPYSTYGDIMFGRDGKDTQIDRIKTLIRNMGKAKVPILGYQWNPRGLVPMRTSKTRRIRGEARATGFDVEDIEDPEAPFADADADYSEAEFWDNYEYFLEEVLPVAEEAGVRMALHPADPPVMAKMGGIPRLFRDFESFKRAMELVPSENHGLKLCLGCFSEMGEDIPNVVRYFGERDEIIFVHFRDVAGTMPSFNETFVDEGNFDELAVMRTLRDVGFDGAMLPDHVPRMEGDSQWGHRANAFTAGYLRGLVEAVLREE